MDHKLATTTTASTPQTTDHSNRKKQEEDTGGDASPFLNLQKNAVIRDSRIFNEANLSVSKCVAVITKILYMVYQGEQFTNEECTEVFFNVTKLFQSQDVNLRRLMYLVIKDIKVPSDESLIVISSLNKDMTSKVDLFRANAIRVLAKVMDCTILGQIERFLKQAIVDKNPFIVSSTLVAGCGHTHMRVCRDFGLRRLHMFKNGGDVIRRWVTEVQEALNSTKSRMVQYHALSLLYKIRGNDKLAISKVSTALARNPPKGPLAQCLHIRMITTIIGNPLNQELLKFLTECLHNSNSMVMFEAARALCRMECITPVLVAPAIVVLQEFLSSPIPVQRFAAVRALNEVVVRFPFVVAPCRADLEHLLSDPNRTIATLAITTLLKTGVESNVDRLMKSISTFMNEITDDFKIVLVDAIQSLCMKIPHKSTALLSFLANCLREEGGYRYKKALVDAMLTVIAANKDVKEAGLEHFCEYIEDCEFPELSIRILHLLGEEGVLYAAALASLPSTLS